MEVKTIALVYCYIWCVSVYLFYDWKMFRDTLPDVLFYGVIVLDVCEEVLDGEAFADGLSKRFFAFV